MAKFTYTVLISITVLMQSGLAATEVSSATPARFVEGEHSLQELIAFPDAPGDVVANVYCVVDVSESGELARNYCFASEQVDQAFREAINTAAKSAKATPAVVSGEAQSVHLWYRVVFVKVDLAAAIGVYPNWGRDVEKYGRDYEGPQQYTDTPYPYACRLHWFNRVENDADIRLTGERRTFFALASVVIGVDGVAKSEVSLDAGSNNLHGSCPDRIRDMMELAKYIPGHHDGEPVEATFVEAWGYYDDMRLD